MSMRRSRQAKALSAIALCLLLAGCASWFKKPVVVKPTARAPESFGAPQTANAAGDAVDRAWWTLFQDPVLNGLQAQLETGNLNLQLLSAKVRQAQASVAASQASLWPSVSVTAGVARSVSSGGGAASNSASVNLPLTWELDVWGRIDLQTQAAQANALASQEDLALARLSAQATLVQTYIAMRTAERQQAVVEKAQVAYERALTLTRYRYDAGVVSAADVAQAESQWQSTVAQRIDVETTRQQLTHSLAVLLGQAPSALQMAASQALPALPALPTVLPASLLQRRPDIRAAEMRVMGAQAQLGVAQTAFFPTFSFAASTGYKSTELVQCIFPTVVFGAVVGLVFVRWRTAPSRQGRCPRRLGSGTSQLPANRADPLARGGRQLGGDPSVAGARSSASTGLASRRAQFAHHRSAVRSRHGQLLECGHSPSQCACRTAKFA